MSAPPPGQPPPETGWGAPPAGGVPPAREHAPGAIASLICGILGITAVPLVLSIVAIVLGNQSRRAAAAEPMRYTDQLGQVGRILGWIGVGLAALMILLALAALAFLVTFRV